jgi:hypothetical protein
MLRIRMARCPSWPATTDSAPPVRVNQLAVPLLSVGSATRLMVEADAAVVAETFRAVTAPALTKATSAAPTQVLLIALGRAL